MGALPPALGPASALQPRARSGFQLPPGHPPGAWVLPSTWMPRVSLTPICYRAWSLACIRRWRGRWGDSPQLCARCLPPSSPVLGTGKAALARLPWGCGQGAWCAPGQPRTNEIRKRLRQHRCGREPRCSRTWTWAGNGAAGTGCISLGFNMSPKGPDGPVWVSAGQRAGRHVAPAPPFLAAGRLRSGFIGELQTGFAQRRRCRSRSVNIYRRRLRLELCPLCPTAR